MMFPYTKVLLLYITYMLFFSLFPLFALILIHFMMSPNLGIFCTQTDLCYKDKAPHEPKCKLK